MDLPDGIKAGFCFRFGDPKFDEQVVFMNEKCVETMCNIINTFDKVFICSNKKEFIQTLKLRFGKNKIFTVDDLKNENSRNDISHLEQWHTLSKCPLVFHHVKTIGSSDNEITTTFAPTAAVYGGCEVIGIDNNGDIFQNQNYHW